MISYKKSYCNAPIFKAYADGGVIKVNPSPLGGTWAYRLVGKDDFAVYEESGVVLPGEYGLETISNNLTELLACLKAMSLLPDGWSGTLCTDSNVTRCRLVNAKPGFVGIPDILVEEVWKQRERLGHFQVVLLDGHPTKKQLALGVGKRGNPVSGHNVRCDELCREASIAYLLSIEKDYRSEFSGVK